VPDLFLAELDAGREAVLDPADREFAEQVGLVQQALGLAIAAVHAPPHIAARRRRTGRVGAVDIALLIVRLGPDITLRAAAIAGGVAQRHAAEVMFGADGEIVHIGLAEVAGLEAVISAARHAYIPPSDRRVIARRAGFCDASGRLRAGYTK